MYGQSFLLVMTMLLATVTGARLVEASRRHLVCVRFERDLRHDVLESRRRAPHHG
jgi:hypothetical protein